MVAAATNSATVHAVRGVRAAASCSEPAMPDHRRGREDPAGVPAHALHADPRGLASLVERRDVDAVDADVLRRRGEGEHPERRRSRSGSSSAAAARARFPRAASAIRPSIASTKNFLVRYMSRNAAQNGLSDHAMPTLAVATVISPSEWPRSLNIVPATQITIANGMPSARYAVGTQASGRAMRFSALMKVWVGLSKICAPHRSACCASLQRARDLAERGKCDRRRRTDPDRRTRGCDSLQATGPQQPWQLRTLSAAPREAPPGPPC